MPRLELLLHNETGWYAALEEEKLNLSSVGSERNKKGV